MHYSLHLINPQPCKSTHVDPRTAGLGASLQVLRNYPYFLLCLRLIRVYASSCQEVCYAFPVDSIFVF